MSEVERFFSRLAADGVLDPEELSGCSSDEVERVREAQGARRIPARYAEFLLLAGRNQGDLMRGSDWSYEDVFELGSDARDLVQENGLQTDFLDGSLVILMHQGYAFYYFPAGTLDDDDPPVWLYEEGGTEPRESTKSFMEFLKIAEDGLRRLRKIEENRTWVEVPYREKPRISDS